MSLKDYLSDLFREPKYRQQFAGMVNTASKTLIVDFEDLMKEPSIANDLVDNPADWLKNAEEVAREQLVIEDSEYAEKIEKVNVRVRNLPEAMPLRKVGALNINKLICVEGIVVRASNMAPKVLKAVFKCPRCNTEITKEQTGISLEYPLKCEDPSCNQTGGFRFLPDKTTYVDSQVLRIQEKPEDLPPGRMPRPFECKIVGEELVDLARPGDHVRISGILHAVPSFGLTRRTSLTFDIYLEVNDIVVQNKETELAQLDDITIEKIKELSKDQWIFNKISNSIAPSIYGSPHIKEAIMYLLFGGVAKQHPDVKIRGEINVLLVGDPGIAKSLLLQASAKLAPRGLYTSGRGTTAAGLTAAVLKDKSGEMNLEAGALVLADKGIACLHPHSKIITEKGIVSFEDLPTKNYVTVCSNSVPFEIAPINLRVVSSDDFGKMSWQQATLVQRKRYKGELFNLHLASGFEVGFTKDHLLRDAVTFDWRPVSSFKVGDYVIAPLKIPEPSAEMYVWDLLPGECKIYLTAEERKKLLTLIHETFGSVSKMARQLGIRRYPFCQNKKGQMQPTLSELRTLCQALGIENSWRESAHNYYRTKVEPVLDERIGYILGFIFGDGHIAETIQVSQSVKHKLLIIRFFKYWNALFPPLTLFTRKAVSEIRGRPVNSTYYVWHTKRKVLKLLLDYLGKDLSKLPITPQNFLKGFIAGLTDANGCSNFKINKGQKQYKVWNITYTISNNRDTNLNFVLALRRFDVNAHYKARGKVGIVVISSRRDCEILQRMLTTFSVKFEKSVMPRETQIGGDSEKISPFLVQDILKEIYETIGASKMLELGLHSTIWGYLNNKRFPSEAQISKVLTLCEPLLSEDQKQKLIQVRYNRDYLIERIEKIVHTFYDGFVYDLRTPAKGNFAAEGLICHNCIDELDKMKTEDRSAMHEALEQHSVSIAKAGIVATLNARTAVLAAANPKWGRYDTSRTIGENVELPITLLSRFDLIFIMIDKPDKAQDTEMSKYILDSHGRTETVVTQVPLDLLRQYISYARQLKPQLTEEAKKIIQDYFLKLRDLGADRTGPIAITPRQLEGLIRIAEAHARIALRDKVTVEDAQAAVAIFNESMQQVCFDATTGKMDRDILDTGAAKSTHDKLKVAYTVVIELEKETGLAETEVVYKELEKKGISRDEAEALIGMLYRDNKIYEPRPGYLKKV